MHYYTFNIGDYMRDTAHLDDVEDLAYRRMLDLYYLRESPLPKSIPEIAKLVRMRTHCESIANVLREFFVLSDLGYVNSKADATLSKIYSKSDKAKAAAEKRWEKQEVKNANALPTDSECNADGMLPINLLTQDLKHNILVDSSESPSDFLETEFNRFWKNYPLKKSKVPAKRTFNAMMKGKKESTVRMWVDLILNYHLDCIDRQEIGADKLHPSTLLKQRRWEDDPQYMETFKQEWIKENAPS